MSSLHWIRPYWLLALIPCILAAFYLWRYQTNQSSWSAICDPHLLKHQLVASGKQQRLSMLPLIVSLLLMILGLAGPSWTKLPTPTYQTVMPRVILLDMSSAMQDTDVKPNRLFRAKLLIRDILDQTKEGQIALIAYSGMPFVVSPLTQDSNTIESLLSSLNNDVMPVSGDDLAAALQEGKQLIEQAGFHIGDLLVITANQPTQQAIETAESLAENNFQTSVLPINGNHWISNADNALAKAGKGMVIDFPNSGPGLQRWLNESHRSHQLQADVMNNVPLWKDEGHWFMLLALLSLIPVFRRGYLEALA
ncbi:VWA domain-containing protein [Legionella sp. W05-934-2]|jgi:Ca-activated chloride channel family protein|uniref:VWA domain-containing protein n=1 Tax=Legionella sp. W05-934-2 TaxID=1198649 RepID=UPI003462DD05